MTEALNRSSEINSVQFHRAKRALRDLIAFNSSLTYLRATAEYRWIVAQGEAALPYLLGALRNEVVVSSTGETLPITNPAERSRDYSYLVLAVEDIAGRNATEGAVTLSDRVEKALEWGQNQGIIGTAAPHS